jgi:hypothetical protein
MRKLVLALQNNGNIVSYYLLLDSSYMKFWKAFCGLWTADYNAEKSKFVENLREGKICYVDNLYESDES